MSFFNGIYEKWGCTTGLVDVTPDKSGRLFTAQFGEHKFQIMRQSARDRSKKMAALKPVFMSLLQSISAIDPVILDSMFEGDMDADDKAQVGLKLLPSLITSISGVDAVEVESAIYDTLAWIKWQDASSSFVPVQGTAYDKLMDDDLFFQIPLAMAVYEVNFGDTINSLLAGSESSQTVA